MISTTLDIVVTSVLQTTAGKMIFGRYIESAPASAPVTPGPATQTAQTPQGASNEKEDPGRRVRPAPQV
jgi:hypothetical protein